MTATAIHIPGETTAKWQGITDLLAEILHVPAALIMQNDPPEIVVLVANGPSGNPFAPGERTRLDSGIYCEAVMRTRRQLLVPDSREDAAWRDNPDAAIGMVSYLGLPILSPTGDVFGTICVLDDHTNHYGEAYRKLLEQCRDVIEADLSALHVIKIHLEEEARAKDVLEHQVADRTAELSRANDRLREEIAERKKLEEALALLLEHEKEAREAAEAAVRMRDDFLSIASHELYTPIAGLKLAVQGMQCDGAALPPRVRKLLGLAERQCQRVVRLIGDLLDVTRIQVGDLALVLEEIDLRALAQEVVERLEAELIQSGSSVRWRADAPVVGTWDRARMEQVVTNLLLNAIKYGAGQPIEVTLEAGDERARLVVADGGIGIEPSRVPHIFERFERGVSAQHYGGLGLGLYITRQIVAAHGGTIEVATALGAGSSFVVEIPRRAGRPSLAEAQAPS